MDNRKSKRNNATRRLHLHDIFSISSGAFAFLFISQVALANECPPEEAVAQVESLQGQLIVNNQPIAKGALVCADDLLATGLFSRAALRLFETQTLLRLDQQTQTRIQASQQPEQSWLEVLEGIIHLFSRDPRVLEVDTPLANAAVEGTEFVVRVTEQQVQVTVVEGDVQVTNNRGALRLDDRQTAFVTPGRAPRLSTLIIPEEAVQWTLYYPPVLQSLIDADQVPPSLRAVIGDFNNANQALRQLARVPFAERNEAYFVYQAGWLLAVGQVSQAQRALDQALDVNPDSAGTQALKAIIAVTQNDELMALALAREAIQSDPDSAAGYLALSYAQQAAFQLDEALNSVQQAVARDPDNALAKARLAELLLSQGKLDDAVDMAEQAADQAPELAHTQTVLGFAYLSRIDTDRAKGTFERAIALDQAAPLPRLGLGLAQIRESDLKDGRENLETAVALDPLRSLYRSYLGKAYFEEKRDTLAGDQYVLAKRLDPMDPTPWLYDAIRKQTQNRPVEALEDIQRSIELNDNRAVYRSRLLLDEDRAARGTSLARIYDDLGFEQLAVNEGSKSLSIDPSNYSAHRFLSDVYAKKPRNKVAQSSAILLAQLLQPINLNPVEPQSTETDLNILLGTSPSEVGFNEFTQLFEQNSVNFDGSGVFGSHNTVSDQAIISGLYNNLSFSLGQFHYETNGFRENNDLQHNIYNAFAQISPMQKLSFQLEHRYRDTDEGDLKLLFDPDFFSNLRDRNVKLSSSRVGLRFSPDSYSDLILSGIYADRGEELADDGGTGISTIRTDNDNRDGYDIQAQYIVRRQNINFISGFGAYDFDGNKRTKFIGTDSGQLFFEANEDRSGESYNGYVYSNILSPESLQWTLGLNIVSFEDGQNKLVDFDRVLPKFGLQWKLSDHFRLRLTAIKTVKRSLIFEQSLQPTQIAGFSQFYDDFNGTIAQLYGLGLDVDINQNFSAGLEVSRRDINVPRIFERGDYINSVPPEGKFTSIFKFEDQREDLFRVYVYWRPFDRWSIASEFSSTRFHRNATQHKFEGRAIEIAAPTLPLKVQTNTIPFSLKYFNPKGLFASIGARYVHQKLDDAPKLNFQSNSSDFFLVNALLGYRLPKRLGIISLQIKNLFDENFEYFDVNLQTNSPNEPVFRPDRLLLGRILINF